MNHPKMVPKKNTVSPFSLLRGREQSPEGDRVPAGELLGLLSSYVTSDFSRPVSKFRARRLATPIHLF
jgi:hypothetical protein